MDTLTIINGIFSLIFATISIIVGATIASRYFKYRQRTLLLVGFAYIGMCEPWLGSGIGFLVAFFTGKALPPEIYAIISMAFLPITLFAWMTAYTDLKYKNKQKLILIIFAIYGVLYEIIFFYLLYIDTDLIIIMNSPTDAEYQTFVIVFVISLVIIVLITGLSFALDSFKSEDPEIRLKGKFLFIAFLSWCIGTVLDGIILLNIITLTITRLLLISSALEFYCGFILPNWIKNLFLKEKKN